MCNDYSNVISICQLVLVYHNFVVKMKTRENSTVRDLSLFLIHSHQYCINNMMSSLFCCFRMVLMYLLQGCHQLVS
jgi:hypothetical protein